MNAFSSLHRISPLAFLLLLGCMLELLFALLGLLFPFQSSDPTFPQSNINWFIFIMSNQSLISKISIPATSINTTGSDLLLLTMTFIVLAAVYLITVTYAFHTGNKVDLTSRWLLLPLIGA